MAKEVEKYPSKKYQYRLFLVLLCGLAVWAYFAMINSRVADEVEPIKGESEVQFPVNANAVELKLYILAKYQFYLCTRQISQNPYPIRVLPS